MKWVLRYHWETRGKAGEQVNQVLICWSPAYMGLEDQRGRIGYVAYTRRAPVTLNVRI